MVIPTAAKNDWTICIKSKSFAESTTMLVVNPLGKPAAASKAFAFVGL